MKFLIIPKGNIIDLLRNCGYRFDRNDERTNQMVFSRPVEGASASGYPRFHIYLKQDNVSRETLINLHLDQKKPIYQGSTAHSGEYDTDIVNREAERIKRILGPVA